MVGDILLALLFAALMFMLGALFILTGVVVVNKVNYIKYTEIVKMRKQCEQHLPLDKHCEIVVTFKEVER